MGERRSSARRCSLEDMGPGRPFPHGLVQAILTLRGAPEDGRIPPALA